MSLERMNVFAKATKSVTVHMKEIRVKTTKPLEKHYKGEIITNLNTDPTYVIYDSATDTTYLRGRLLGKGGFAKCYELTDLKTSRVYAGKIISKNRISKPHQRQKILREVELHRDLKHKHVVEFHNFFEDEDNVYIVLENCCRKSLVHVVKHRKTLTETEVRYYVKHLIEGVRYIHNRNIIHRDLKLGNMLLNDNMDLKIADFGLATRVDYEGEKKMTVCGTPNYIAPEVLQKKGHSYEADIWAIGCVMYALLVGRPPFETSSLKETYVRITANSYFLPPGLSHAAKNLIRRCLTPEPELRPTLDDLMADEFLTSGYVPKVLPTSSCTSAPKFTSGGSRPMSYAVPVSQNDAMKKITSSLSQWKITTKGIQPEDREEEKEVVLIRERPLPSAPSQPDLAVHTNPNQGGDIELTPASKTVIKDKSTDKVKGDRSSSPSQRDSTSPRPLSASVLLDVLTTCLDHMPKDVEINPKSMADPAFVWITKWVDYSNKYGFGFQLSNNAIGVLFNDTSRIGLGPDGRAVQYYDLSGKLSAYTTDCTPGELQKKTTLLQHFAQYMDEHLIQGGDMDGSRDLDETWSGGLYLKKWFRTAKAIVLYLSDGTLQVNFFDDHTKIILSYYKMDYLVTYIDENRKANTYCLTNLIHDGCRQGIMDRMNFAKLMLQNLVAIEGEDI